MPVDHVILQLLYSLCNADACSNLFGSCDAQLCCCFFSSRWTCYQVDCALFMYTSTLITRFDCFSGHLF